MAGSGEFKRGWKVVLAASLGVGCGLSPIPFYTIGVFVLPLAAAFGWTVDQVLAALIVSNLSMLVSSPFMGLLSDRYGVRRVALGSTICFGLSFLLFAFNPGSLPLFYATYSLLNLVGAGTLPITWTRAVNSWFRQSRGLALGLSLLATGLFGSIAKIYAHWLIEHYGWRMAYAGLALFPLLIALPVALAFFHERKETAGENAPPETGMSLSEALATRRFWTMSAALLLITLTIGGIMPNLERLMTSKGFDAGTAVELAGIVGIGVLIGRPLGGWLIDRLWAPGVAFLLLGAPAIAFLILSHLALTPALGGFCVFLIGFALGVEYDVVAFLIARYFGMRAYSAIYGSLYAAYALGAGFGPYLIGHQFTREHSYDGVLNISAALLLLGAALLLTLGRYPKLGRTGDLDG
jgi:MFS family permease